MYPLTVAQPGQEMTVAKIGGNDKTKAHLKNLGFVEGGKVTVVNELDGNVIVQVKDARIGISKEMAAKIMVN